LKKLKKNIKLKKVSQHKKSVMRKLVLTFLQFACFILFLPLRLNAVCDQAWVGDNFGNVAIINTQTQMQTSLFMPGDEVASGITFTPDGSQVFLTDSSNGIWAIDASTQASTQISMQMDSNDIVMSPNGQFAYVAVGNLFLLMGSILKIDTATDAITTLNAAPYTMAPNGIAITPDGSKLYIVGQSTVLVIDSSTGNILQTVTIPSAVQLFKVAITPDGAFAYVTDNGTGIGGGNVFQINTSSFSVAPVSTGAFLPFSAPWGVTINPNGQFAYVTDGSNNVVDVIQISSNAVVNQLLDPSINEPRGITVTPDGSFLYVAEFGAPFNLVTVINTSTFAINTVTTGTSQPIVIAMAPPCVTSLIKGRIGKNKDFWQTNIFSQLCWNAPAAFIPIQYLIFRNGKLVGTISGDQTFFRDNYLRPDKTYLYSIFAVNNANVQFLVGNIILKTE
jgi:DNA-binding beta-propeller fold protein YncE